MRHMQASSAAVLMEGGSAVLAAETGSGKTIAYLAPIASLLLRKQKEQQDAEKCAVQLSSS
jgi:superfamily II DNA/RNA helicase